LNEGISRKKPTQIALVGNAPEIPCTILLAISGHDRDDGILSNQMGPPGNSLDDNLSRSGSINKARAPIIKMRWSKARGRTAQYRPPAIAARRGVPGENARIAALALLILGRRQR